MLFASFFYFSLTDIIFSVKEKLPEIDSRYFGNYFTYLHVLIYFHDSGQRPNGLLAKFSSMRYSDATMKFFWLGKKLFGSQFIRFMSGPKNETDVLVGKRNLHVLTAEPLNYVNE